MTPAEILEEMEDGESIRIEKGENDIQFVIRTEANDGQIFHTYNKINKFALKKAGNYADDLLDFELKRMIREHRDHASSTR